MRADERILLSYLGLLCTVGSSLAHRRSHYLADYLPSESDCPGPHDRQIHNKQRPWGEARRAYNTLPDGLDIRNSSIPGAGLGVFTWVFIPRFTFLGLYEGEIVSAENISPYAWEAQRDGEVDYYIDGADIETSSWHRFINCPRHKVEENVEILQCRGKVFYVSQRDIYPGEELMVYYGEKYARWLGIDVYRYKIDWERLPSWERTFKEQLRPGTLYPGRK